MQATYLGGDERQRLERVAHNRSGLWVALAITLVALLIFTGIFNLILPDFGARLDGLPLVLLGLIFSVVPAAIWLFFFYRLDHLEPEPKQMVFSVFIVGALVAAALHTPLIQGLFSLREWQFNSWWSNLLGNILIAGFIEQALIYYTVRYTVFRHPEFDERVDGVIYAVAAGLGLATVGNFQYVFASGGVDLDIGSIRMVVNALAYASFAGILGYFIGQARFEKTPAYYLPLGLALAAVLNGLFFFLLDRTFGGGLEYNPWSDLIFAAIVTIVTLALTFWLIERANEETLRLAHNRLRETPNRGVGNAPVMAPAATTVPPSVPPTAPPTSTTPPAAPGPEAGPTRTQENG
ncbi:MAG TPA: PrsW family glutamic-type intramembrane protease [Caldilineaceae bacterium]|nr:PrsW family glutamic-type intramembrane protease [Caldilineaceae bacterium]